MQPAVGPFQSGSSVIYQPNPTQVPSNNPIGNFFSSIFRPNQTQPYNGAAPYGTPAYNMGVNPYPTGIGRNVPMLGGFNTPRPNTFTANYVSGYQPYPPGYGTGYRPGFGTGFTPYQPGIGTGYNPYMPGSSPYIPGYPGSPYGNNTGILGPITAGVGLLAGIVSLFKGPPKPPTPTYPNNPNYPYPGTPGTYPGQPTPRPPGTPSGTYPAHPGNPYPYRPTPPQPSGPVYRPPIPNNSAASNTPGSAVVLPPFKGPWKADIL